VLIQGVPTVTPITEPEIKKEPIDPEISPSKTSSPSKMKCAGTAINIDTSPAKSTRFSKQKDSGKLKMENIKIGKEPELTRRRPVRQASKVFAQAQSPWVSALLMSL
jgi:hypothetical protein